ncbi:metal-dependent hydrolase [Luteimicrobium album]|uniref:Metal-dependent hydrolase n=1 Tax=Luteimicrobium album TaxID=1054550 RepID=A0ABQ6I8D7_9MICO|nr:metal-dependent hydrolase [Luteimicrobium album]GMA26228.1 metal-dependent hydrolase [Luteimicrobium album]
MMGGHHAASGAAAWVAVTATAPFAFGWYPVSHVGVATGAVVCAGAALLPDADHHDGTIANSLPPVSHWVCRAVGAVSGGHRHGTHSVLGIAVFTGLAWLLGHWRMTVDGFGVVDVGAGVMAVLLAAYALKALRLVRGKVAPWLGALTLATLVAFFSPTEWTWLPLAVGIGCAVHVVGDMLTTGGVPLLWPVRHRPPRWWASTNVLNDVWKRGGNVALPILGDAGSRREWALLVPVSAYAVLGVGWALLEQMGFDTADAYARVSATLGH